MKIEIKSVSYSDVVLYAYEEEGSTLKKTLEKAVREGANLYGADLSGANLYGADLSGANMLGHSLTKTPLFLTGMVWSTIITEEKMKIGCQTHTHEEWRSFSDEVISKMDNEALAFWKQNKKALLALCDSHAM